jgi:plastocyanin
VGEAVNGDFGKRVLGPFLIPIGAFAFIGVLVFAFSRILLAVPKDGSVVVGVLMAGCILFACGALAKGGTLKQVQRTALIAFGLLLIGGGIATGATIGTRAVEEHLKADVKIATASRGAAFAFDTRELKVPAGKAFGIEFDNKDATQHNIAFGKTAGATDLLNSPGFAGPAKRLFKVEAIPTGAYFFECIFHPQQMKGVVLAGNATAPPGGSPAPAPSSPQPSPSGPPPGQAEAAPITLVAKDFSFDLTTLTFEPNKTVVLNFDNQGAAVHNFALYADSTLKTLIFRGDPTTGAEKKRYEFAAPAPGTYYFQCDYHPGQMKGSASVS